jgi:hypothetical protein
MTNVMQIAALFGWVCLATYSPRASAQDNFTPAIRNNSTSPRLLLVTIEYADHSKRMIATSGQALLQALAKERGFEKWTNWYEVAQTAALVGKNRPFRFTKPDALKLIEPSYTPEVLAEARKKIGGLNSAVLAARLRRTDGFKDIYPADSEQRPSYQMAVAHILLERGIPVQINCLDGLLGSAQ